MGSTASKGTRSVSGKNSALSGYKKRALLVACNYPGTSAELAGCVNDSENWKSVLTDFFGFEEQDIIMLLDVGDKTPKPTGKNIKDSLKQLVEASQKGDVLFFQFSGHGVQVPADEGGDYEEDGLDEALCPCDLNLIVDDDLRQILSKLDSGVKFTMVSDCCHSGGMLDHNEIIIKGDSEHDKKIFTNAKAAAKEREILLKDLDLKQPDGKKLENKNRSIDIETVKQILANNQGANESTPFRDVLYELYGEDASNAALAKKRDMDLSDIHYVGPGKKPDVTGLIDPNKGILITGCQSHETSADVTGKDGKAFGALSHTITRVMKKYKRKNKHEFISNRDIVLKVRQLLAASGFEQNPCLECSEENANSNFIIW